MGFTKGQIKSHCLKGTVAQFYGEGIEQIILWKYCPPQCFRQTTGGGFMDKTKQKAIKFAKQLLKIKREIRQIKKQLDSKQEITTDFSSIVKPDKLKVNFNNLKELIEKYLDIKIYDFTSIYEVEQDFKKFDPEPEIIEKLENEIGNLENEVEELEEKIDDLETKNLRLEKELTVLKSKNQ